MKPTNFKQTCKYNKIMTSKEKAEELINKFIPHTRVFHEVLGWEDYIDSAKQCALIAVDEIIENGIKWMPEVEYWMQVKTEISNL